MLQKERKQRILEYLQENGSGRVAELSRLFGVTEPTIRHDLSLLEEEGRIIRQHGGASVVEMESFNSAIELQPRGNEDKKAAIGRKAASFVSDGDIMILDSGSTVTELARNITSMKDLSIITNAINIALMLGKEPTNNVILIGGEFKFPTLSLTGDRGLGILQDIHVSKLFLATGGLSIAAGLTYPSFSDIEIKKKMIESAETVYLLADSTKIGKTLFTTLCPLQGTIDVLVTDSGITDEAKAEIESLGIKVVIA